jgi:hypothetical protein
MPGQFVDSIINENLKVATEYFKATVSNIEKNPDSGGTIGFIPFKINFTVDGISGIKIYNELNVNTDFLPNGYTKTTKFIVTGVDHKLSNGDWETVINTTLIPNASNIGIITREIVLATRNKEAKKEAPEIKTPPVIPDQTSTTILSPTVTPERDLWILLAIMSREGVGGQSRVDVVQTILNRAGSGKYKANNIYELVTGKTQYEPAFSDRDGNVANEWKNVKDFNTAKIAFNYKYKTSDKKAYTLREAKNAGYNTLDEFLGAKLKQSWLDLKNTTYTTKASSFVQGRVDFKAPGEYGNSTATADADRRSREARKKIVAIFPTDKTNNVWRGTTKDNMFGWMYNYITNTIYPFPTIADLDKLKSIFDNVIIKG